MTAESVRAAQRPHLADRERQDAYGRPRDVSLMDYSWVTDALVYPHRILVTSGPRTTQPDRA
jgi:hypothetical protein